ncbi:MAG: hypothetical protein ACOYNU_03615 [Bacteroidales bacterium]
MVSVNSVAFAGRVTGAKSAQTTIIFARVGLMVVEVMLIPARAEFPTALEKVALVGSYSILSVTAQILVNPLTVIGTSVLEDGHASLMAAVVTGAFRAKELMPKSRINIIDKKQKILTTDILCILIDLTLYTESSKVRIFKRNSSYRHAVINLIFP